MLTGLGARSLTSVLVVLVALVVVYSPPWLLTLVLLALGAVGVSEMYGLLGGKTGSLPLPLGVGLVSFLVLSAASARLNLLAASAFLSGAVPLAWAMYRGPRTGGLQVWAFSAVGALYVGWPLAHIELLRYLPDGQAWVVLAIACTWATDTGAYLCGSMFGRRKLAPSISPGKTIEGAVGALALTFLVALVTAPLVGLDLSVGTVALLGLVLSVVAQMGDLAESYIKRVAGTKDSGSLLPGHGGLLDRIDGLLWVVVATYYIALAFVG